MSFLTPALLAGIALIGVPILLHLAKRKQPVREVFPALRLLKRNRHRNEARLRLRRWLLLALRCAAVALLALALARPILRPPTPPGVAADAGPAGEGLAVAMVFDNAPNAGYQSRNETRLDATRATATWLLEQLPSDAWVATADRSRRGRAAEGDPDSAASRLERMRISPATRPLGATVRDALAQLAEAAAARREAYVFTDLSAGAWDEATRDAVAAALERTPGVVLRLVDTGVAEPRNLGVASIDLSGESLATGETLRLDAAINATGEWREPVAAQLWVDTPVGPVKRDERSVEFAEGGDPVARFALAGLDEGFHTGFVQLATGDALPADDARYFCVEVRNPRSLLIASESDADAVFFRSAVAPEAAAAGVVPRYACRVVRHGGWSSRDLADADAVVLLDPPPLEGRRNGWRALYDYAAGGGAVGVFLGRRASLDGFNTPGAQTLLPAPLRWRSRDETYLRPTRYSHPAVASLAPYAEAIPWAAFPVYQRWELGELRDGAAVVARYAGGGAAIVEQAVGRGRVLVMTTPVSDRLNRSGGRSEAWNLLPTGEDPWPFVLLANSIVDYLTGRSEARLNYTAGQAVAAPLPPGVETPGFVLRTPGGDVVRQSVAPGATELSIASADQPGAYRVEAGGERGLVDRRFAVNLDPAAGRLTRVPFEEIQRRLGRDRVVLARSREELATTIDLGRVGRELYGWLLPLVAAAMAAEQIISNRFYRETEAPAG